MGLYKIEWKESVHKDFKKLDKPHVALIVKTIEALAKNPRPHNSKKLVDTKRTYRVRVGDYRVIYQVDDSQKTVLLNYVSHRKDAY